MSGSSICLSKSQDTKQGIGKSFLGGIVKKSLEFKKLGCLLACNPGGAKLAQRSLYARQENDLLTIQKVSALLKVPKPTLRFWEKELDGILSPLRTDGVQRRYTLENIAVIDLLQQCASTAREIQKLKRKGMSLPEIKTKLGKGQMSEVRGQRSEVGSQRTGDERTDRVDLLVARVAEVVRAEVNRFFEGVED